MPAKSKAQQKAAGAALAAKRGEVKKSELKGASKSMEKSMTEQQLDELGFDQAQGQARARLEVLIPARRHRAIRPCRRAASR